jgi:HD-GYP domain-containing protein (c-di-GMP phosphodiesterase class II)
MTSDRPYRQAMSQASAREEMQEHAGTQFDPDVVRTLFAALDSP